MLPFHVVDGTTIRQIISVKRAEIIDSVKSAYIAHHSGQSVNPNSYFLRFPDKPDARIIALPSYLGGDVKIAGIKWIASFPANVINNVPRASAVLVLNDYVTGYPIACLEGSQISAARTAASAVVGAEQLFGGRQAQRIAIVGAGVIARNIVDFFYASAWAVDQFLVHDQVERYGNALVQHCRKIHSCPAETACLEKAIEGADIVVLATTAGTPYITDPRLFRPGQIILNISLRDLSPEVIINAHNVLDDVNHCMTGNTSPHLAEQKYGHRDFIDGTLAQLLLGELRLTNRRPKIFSPFGLGVLDLAVGSLVLRCAKAEKQSTLIDGFFGEMERWSSGVEAIKR